MSIILHIPKYTALPYRPSVFFSSRLRQPFHYGHCILQIPIRILWSLSAVKRSIAAQRIWSPWRSPWCPDTPGIFHIPSPQLPARRPFYFGRRYSAGIILKSVADLSGIRKIFYSPENPWHLNSEGSLK